MKTESIIKTVKQLKIYISFLLKSDLVIRKSSFSLNNCRLNNEILLVLCHLRFHAAYKVIERHSTEQIQIKFAD